MLKKISKNTEDLWNAIRVSLHRWLGGCADAIKRSLGIYRLEQRIIDLEKLVGERTTVHCDVHTKEPCEVIVIGRYRNKEYVRCFHLKAESIDQLIIYLQNCEKHAKRGRFDMVGAMPFSAVYELENF